MCYYDTKLAKIARITKLRLIFTKISQNMQIVYLYKKYYQFNFSLRKLCL